MGDDGGDGEKERITKSLLWAECCERIMKTPFAGKLEECVGVGYDLRGRECNDYSVEKSTERGDGVVCDIFQFVLGDTSGLLRWGR